MPTDEYRSAPGGALKLKGSKISKRSHHHNKKKRPKSLSSSPSSPPPQLPQSPPLQQPAEDEEQRKQKDDDGPLSKRRLVPVANNNNNNNDNGEKKQNIDRVAKDEGRDDAAELEDGLSVAAVHTEGDKKRIWAVGKTEAERRHEEQRRKRLDERLKREGIKTHKERVEELNRYLSNLSEHHDMPRIGPG